MIYERRWALTVLDVKFQDIVHTRKS